MLAFFPTTDLMFVLLQVSDKVLKLEMARSAAATTLGARRDNIRRGQRRGRTARRGSSETGKSGNADQDAAESAASRHLSEGNVSAHQTA
jgi:hypothetical protein